MRRIMIAGTHSGCGKTTVACALLRALARRGLAPSAFKCGPDYIDPMFHSRVIGIPSRNLDGWFCGEGLINYLLKKHGGDLAVIEGVMGYYDGVGEAASSRAAALATGTPAALVIDCKGMSLSLGAVMRGFLSFREPSGIAGFIFNRLPESLVPTAKELCAELNTKYLGRLPYKKELSFESRRLGLVTAAETADLREKLDALADLAEEHILIDELLEAAKAARERPSAPPVIHKIGGKPPKIAVARDNAFCFYYEDNLDLLREIGCEIAEFSPLADTSLPEGACGLLLGGGYPELYADELSKNKPLLADIRRKIASGLPTIAECGGFMYLCESIGGRAMTGVIATDAFETDRLRRFGYITMKTARGSLFGERELRAHEFHYCDCGDPGSDCEAVRARGGSYACAHLGPSLYAGFPHIYLYSCPEAAESFVKKCQEYENAQT